jgi:hypothetical protein
MKMFILKCKTNIQCYLTTEHVTKLLKVINAHLCSATIAAIIYNSQTCIQVTVPVTSHITNPTDLTYETVPYNTSIEQGMA